MADNPNNLQPWSIATTAAVTALSFVAVCLRLLSRYERKQPLWWDDWLIMWSMAWNLVVVGFIYAMIKSGMGLHADTVDPHKIVLMAKFLLVAEVLYVWNLVWTKLSLLLMYYRIFHFPYFKRWAYIIGAFILMWVVCITFLFIFICVPVQKIWYTQLPGRCIDQVGTWISNAISTIISDLATLILPLPQIWKLQLRKSEKAALTVAFGLGFFVIFASAYRLSVLFSYTNADPTYTLAPTVGWTAIEMSAGIVSACLPTLRPAFLLIARTIGIRGTWLSVFREAASGASKTGQSNNNTTGVLAVTNSERNHNREESGGSFYRLPDDSKHGAQQIVQPVDVDLRPEHGYVYTVSSVAGRKDEQDSLSGDEIPLHSISVQKKFMQVRQ